MFTIRHKYSSFTGLIRVTAWMLRFVKRLLKQSYENDSLTPEELTEAEKIWIRYTQREHFPCVLDKVHGNKCINVAQQLGVFKDEEGLLHCRGRLEHSNLSQGARYPILLHGKERLTSMIVDRVHRSNLHRGISQTLAQIRLKYWIPKGRSVIKTVQRNCNVCRHHEGGPCRMPALVPLPPRVQEAPPFSRTGLDYFGPLYIKTLEVPRKTCVCLFTCMVIRAVHLELLQNMLTEEFLMGFRRFISQKGTPNEIFNDNARQFKAASEVLKQIWKTTNSDIVQSYTTMLDIITELAPWIGGFYERLVGIVKRSLRKAIARRMLTLIQLQTILK